jgi:CheY-like chemotaxis protein
MRILAEDEEALARFVRQALEGEHYSVDVLPDGEPARTVATEFEYDVAILDLNLPKLDGVSVLRHLRSKRPSLPVPGLTQRTRVEDRVQCLDQERTPTSPNPCRLPPSVAERNLTSGSSESSRSGQALSCAPRPELPIGMRILLRRQTLGPAGSSVSPRSLHIREPTSLNPAARLSAEWFHSRPHPRPWA